MSRVSIVRLNNVMKTHMVLDIMPKIHRIIYRVPSVASPLGETTVGLFENVLVYSETPKPPTLTVLDVFTIAM